MKSKEEIQRMLGINVEAFDNQFRDLSKRLDEVLDEYAKEVAIEFSKFKQDYQHIEAINARHEFNKLGGGAFTWLGANDEKIWNAFQKGEQLKRYYETI